MSQSGAGRIFSSVSQLIDDRVGWPRLPKYLGLFTLVGIRHRLRAQNLFDSGRGPADRPPVNGVDQHRDLASRTADGTYNDLADPLMGSIGSRFGRNVPLHRIRPETEDELLTPNPRTVSLELMTRHEFQPATTLNVLAAAWIQFEVHDWFGHGLNSPDKPFRIPLGEDDSWPVRPMEVRRTRPDPSGDADGPPTFVTSDTHWWDGSQIYGTDPAFARAIRAGELGKLRVDGNGLIPPDVERAVDLRTSAGNFWVGLALLHGLFMKEHNAVCDHLHEQYPELTDEQLYDKARLVVSALMAKIHTVDWTPAIIAHPTTVKGMNANWWGLFGERLAKRFGRLTSWEVIHGIPGSGKALYDVPFSLTEEFVAVYRMHPLIPDAYEFRAASDDSLLATHQLPDLGVRQVRERLSEISVADAFYSFGIAHPGAVTLNNYPAHLQCLLRPDGELLDLAAVDIIRSRERGVPRYNDFRRLFHLRPAASFEELAADQATADRLRAVYDGDIERVDLMVGLYAETPPKGFGFSDTAFRVFILMASRRLEADRFFTDDYRPEIYTAAGLEWVESNSMRSVLLRHYPELAGALEGVQNPFAPWRRVA